ncbi:MAG: imidazole glycerol phosphate synthase subunit HisH [Xanthomonadales bacterium]|nr:imidazole glycerol phosphate synthase subunit HisH [Xanthomonadales bacterium]NIN58800.1 imidazole glycerol phosphate synthase subunit HisH [Xanthomonadales bacterium]NIN74068.1 imidazole glycerol phosphate synthase subunit HisH [Xanthomonadales bacterium]NIO14601.1 imidazole glycerol phosphate synthase subunit HisH [Xanthomonadales bacterium]NIP11193.1 imidazole glycerol phosphate synthase subunit HisH [Xanthomonadales bacterium]
MSLAVVDSGGANITSVLQALRRLGVDATFTADPAVIEQSERVILPGVGSAGAAMQRLRATGLDTLIPQLRQPVLGICLGMQLLFAHSTEADTTMLGIVPAGVQRLPDAPGLRIPHMGWNRITPRRADPLLEGLDEGWFYFVHSYAAPLGDWTLASSEHGQAFSAIVQHGNFRGAQFHPERSAAAGARLLRNFLDLPCS